MKNKVMDEIREELAGMAGAVNDGNRPHLEEYLIDAAEPAPCVIICPGGAYGFTSPRESRPVAEAFNAQGFHAFVLHYRLGEDRHPAPLLDLSNCTALIRTRAEELNILPGRIAVCGFSAGGHLAASLGVHWQLPVLKNEINDKEGLNRPDALVLCYPVISAGEYGHQGSFTNLLGENPSEELRHLVSLEFHAGRHTPPVFIWHTVEDEDVPMENSLLFVQKLRRENIKFEFHLYTHGVHGMSLANEETAEPEKNRIPDKHLSSWLTLCTDWLKINM